MLQKLEIIEYVHFSEESEATSFDIKELNKKIEEEKNAKNSKFWEKGNLREPQSRSTEI